ncbi:MAG: hypothetical protein AAF548_18545, partial [Actinomycetota bacterium]
AQTRCQLDDRNSVDRPCTVYEMISDLWNDKNYDPVTKVLYNCHPDYEDPLDISYTAVSSLSPATPKKIEDMLTTMRTSLIRVISNWERSGQGEGSTQATDGNDVDNEIPSVICYETGEDSNVDQFGSLQGRSRPALVTRCNFLMGNLVISFTSGR